MKRLVLDTNAYSALRKGDQKVFDAICEAEKIYISAIVMGELYAGFYNGVKIRENIKQLRNFLDKSPVEPAFVTDETAEIYGHLFTALRKKGTPLPLNDIWIAAQTMELGAVLISFDKHFERISGLRIFPDP
jgi:tRNA(fMet)-specific endonuclease VapC